MVLFRQSRAEDIVDRWNNFWTVLIFIVLGLVTFMYPLRLDSSWNDLGVQIKATCWCPPEFTDSQVTYSNSYCAAMYSRVRNYNSTQEGLYNMEKEGGSKARYVPPARESKSSSKDLPLKERVKYMPFLFFLFAFVIKLPYALASLFSCCMFNADQSLTLAEEARSLDVENRQETIQQLAHSAKEDIKSSKCSASLVFLLVKLLCCAIVFIGILTVFVRPEVNSESPNQTDSANGMGQISPEILICDLQIRQFANVKQFSLQCSFDTVPNKSATNLGTYNALFNVILVYLVILFLANVISLVTWFARLVLGQCQVPSATADQGSSMDVQFLVSMSHLNEGPLLTKHLLQHLSSPSNDPPAADEPAPASDIPDKPSGDPSSDPDKEKLKEIELKE